MRRSKDREVVQQTVMPSHSKVITPDVIVQHGSWNRAVRNGYNVIRIPMRNGKADGSDEDFLTGFITKTGEVWGRPVVLLLVFTGIFTLRMTVHAASGVLATRASSAEHEQSWRRSVQRQLRFPKRIEPSCCANAIACNLRQTRKSALGWQRRFSAVQWPSLKRDWRNL
jgi:hypothetical protein